MITKYTFIFFFCLYSIYVHIYLNCQKIYNFKCFIIYLVKKGILGFSVCAPLHCRKNMHLFPILDLKIKNNWLSRSKKHTLKIMFRDQWIFSIKISIILNYVLGHTAEKVYMALKFWQNYVVKKVLVFNKLCYYIK